MTTIETLTQSCSSGFIRNGFTSFILTLNTGTSLMILKLNRLSNNSLASTSHNSAMGEETLLRGEFGLIDHLTVR